MVARETQRLHVGEFARRDVVGQAQAGFGQVVGEHQLRDAAQALEVGEETVRQRHLLMAHHGEADARWSTVTLRAAVRAGLGTVRRCAHSSLNTR
ncbi:hypothetical protein FQZ97_970640 [compost metagenome]